MWAPKKNPVGMTFINGYFPKVVLSAQVLGIYKKECFYNLLFLLEILKHDKRRWVIY